VREGVFQGARYFKFREHAELFNKENFENNSKCTNVKITNAYEGAKVFGNFDKSEVEDLLKDGYLIPINGLEISYYPNPEIRPRSIAGKCLVHKDLVRHLLTIGKYETFYAQSDEDDATLVMGIKGWSDSHGFSRLKMPE
jgi:hypothetical protein